MDLRVLQLQRGGAAWRQTFFFFQAEDGIRDWSVTGVQTCALPILRRCSPEPAAHRTACPWAGLCRGSASRWGRSEERRVGKECRSRGWPDQEKKEDGICGNTWGR